MDSNRITRHPGNSTFPRTRWTLVVQAASPDVTTAHRALEEICGIYWQPIYSYLRRSGYKPEDAEDLTQGFFAELLAARTLSVATSERGRLRSFLLGSLKRHLSRHARRSGAQKRGGNIRTISLDHEAAELHYASELLEGDSPDVLFDRAWARQIVSRSQEALRVQYTTAGKGESFSALAEFLAWNKGNAAYREAAARLGLSETNLRTSVYRLRKRYRQMLEREIADTVETVEQAREELQHLLEVLGAR